MIPSIIAAIAAASIAVPSPSAPLPLRADSEMLWIFHDDRRQAPWVISPQIPVDSLLTSAREVTLTSGIDTLRISTATMTDYSSADINVITATGDTALTRLVKIPEVVYANPPASMKRRPGSRLSREQALFDIDALVYALTEIHPDIYSVAGHEKLHRAFNAAREAVTDSMTTIDLYRITAPAVSLIGDGHTMLRFPFNDLLTRELRRLPLHVGVKPDGTLTASRSYDSLIPAGARIRSINGVADSTMISAMLPYVSGERRHFKFSRINDLFNALFELFYGGADSYEVAYTTGADPEMKRVALPAATWDEIGVHMPKAADVEPGQPYSYTIDSDKGVAVMDFNACRGSYNMMKSFCDSMFTDLRNRGIDRLIIDVRKNGGGDSRVGDALLSYLAPRPFTQFDKTLVKISPMTARMTGRTDGRPTVRFQALDPDNYIKPLTADEGHFGGTTVLLTSSDTFSSASSFAWAFRQAGCGKVVGEETGGMNVSFGDILGWSMPISGLYSTISWKRFWLMEADEFDIHGVIPDVAVDADAALNTALGILSR